MSDFMVRASALNGYRETVLALGGNPASLLAAYGLEDGDPEHWVSYRDWLHMMEHTARVLQCPHFGLLLSERQDINILGAVGFMIRQAPDVRTALRELGVYFNHHNQGATVSITVRDDKALWSFAPRPHLHAPIAQQSDLVAGIAAKIMQLLAPNWRPIAIYLPHSAPDDMRPYEQRFNCPVHFDWDTTVVVCDARYLDSPLSEADAELHRILELHLKVIREFSPHDFRGRVSHLIRQALNSGDCSVERVSDYLGMNKRTLQRRLRDEGTTYKELLDDIRFEIACNYLTECHGPLTALSHILCYSELSAFSNAFRRRFGQSPREWKRQRQAAGA